MKSGQQKYSCHQNRKGSKPVYGEETREESCSGVRKMESEVQRYDTRRNYRDCEILVLEGYEGHYAVLTIDVEAPPPIHLFGEHSPKDRAQRRGDSPNSTDDTEIEATITFLSQQIARRCIIP